MLHYTVTRAFARDGVYYTRENAHDIKALPREFRNDLIAQGAIEEHDDAGPVPDAEPASPAKPRTGGK